VLCAVETALRAMAPPGCHVAVEPVGAAGGLLGGEVGLTAGAAPARRRTFAAGRRAARRALVAAGGRPQSLLRGAVGEPLWPPGFGGSITHGRRLAAAVAWRSADDRAPVGLDVVDDLRLDRLRTAAHLIASDAERDVFGVTAPADLAELFSAKEAAVKVVSPALGRPVGLLELRLVDDRPPGPFPGSVGAARRDTRDLLLEGPGGTRLRVAVRLVAGVVVSVAERR
jgi:4'-phosphopantetheinyl transferase EntD